MIKIRNLDNLYVKDINDINLTEISVFFSRHPNQIIYIIDNLKLMGIITLGDFIRHIRYGHRLINNSFLCFTENEKGNAVKQLIVNKKIGNVPIVNANGEILFEYYKEDSIIDKTPEAQRVMNFFRILERYGIKQIVIMNDYIYYCEVCEIVNKIKCASFIDNIFNIDYSDISGMEHILIISQNTNQAFVEELIYGMKYPIIQQSMFNFLLCYAHEQDFDCLMDKFVELLYSSYNGIAILNNSDMSSQLIEKLKKIGAHVLCIEEQDIEWKINDYSCYYINKEAEYTPEVVITCDFRMISKQIKMNGEDIFHLPFHNMYYGDCTRYYGYNYEKDIILNIIPKLLEHNVKVIVLNDPLKEVECDNLYSFSPNDAKKLKLEKELSEMFDMKVIEEFERVPIIIKDGYPDFSDYNGEAVTIVGGKRLLHNNQSLMQNSVHLFGPCMFYGRFVNDVETIAYYLQNNLSGTQYEVRNWTSVSYENIAWKMRTVTYHEGDIVILLSFDASQYKSRQIETYSLKKAYLENNTILDKVLWDNVYHCNSLINRSIADELYNILTVNNYILDGIFSDNPIVLRKHLNDRHYEQVDEWLKTMKHVVKKGNNGAIVMNCNPCTYGHKYLIEFASARVDYLYIFIVEEDKSYFPFHDRIQLVQEVTKDIGNVIVIPGGKYIISAMTLPGYFDKDNLQDVTLDASLDLDIFSNCIAPYFNVRTRFAGKEPLDAFTNQYNIAMSEILPLHGIEFVEIERKNQGEAVISASRVRKYLKESNFTAMKELVPECVYKYLINMKK